MDTKFVKENEVRFETLKAGDTFKCNIGKNEPWIVYGVKISDTDIADNKIHNLKYNALILAIENVPYNIESTLINVIADTYVERINIELIIHDSKE